MLCPKCGHENLPDRLDCQRCGVIFAKVRQGLAPQVPVPEELDETATALSSPFEPVAANENSWQLWGWVLGLLVMSVWGGKVIFVNIADNAAGSSLLHLVNLPFHEAGHVLFRPFGSFLTSLGGTLGQLLTESGLLDYDHALARASHVIGALLMLGAVCWVGSLLYRHYQKGR